MLALAAFPLLLLLSVPVSSLATTPSSPWQHVPSGPPDPILGIAAAFRACDHADKTNVCVGAYRTDTGQPWVLPTVLTAQERLLQQEREGTANKEYLPIEGDSVFLQYAMEFAYGRDTMSKHQIAAVQTLSGTGACRIAGEFLYQQHQQNKCIYIPTPTWGNHWKIFAAAGLDTQPYRYFQPKTLELDIEGLLDDINAAPEGSIILLHACAHNPTGCDPTQEQWKRIARVCQEKHHVVLFDSAYQGFASGDPEADAWALRHFVSLGDIPILLAQSFAKNFGLYGERCGTLSVVCGNENEERERVVSQLRTIIRPMYSSPPKHGSSIVSTILSDAALAQDYKAECASMAERMLSIRTRFAERLQELADNDTTSTNTPLDWSHITRQIGMFAYTGHLQPDMCDRLMAANGDGDEQQPAPIFLTRDGRISLAGLNDGNLERVAQAIHAVTTTTTAEVAPQ